MAARERQRDKQQGAVTRRLSWPTAVLAGGILLSLAANLAPAQGAGDEAREAEDEALLALARRAAAEHQGAHGQPITRDQLRARLGVSNQAASELLRQLRAGQGQPPGAPRAA